MAAEWKELPATPAPTPLTPPMTSIAALGGYESYDPACGGYMHSNRCATYCHEFGRFVSYPATLFLTDAVLAFARPITPGLRGQCASAELEAGARLLRVIKLIILLPFAIAFGALGGIIRTAVNQSGALNAMAVLASAPAAANDNTNNRPTAATAPTAATTTTTTAAPSQLPPTRVIRIRVCTYNVGCMPEFISVWNGLRPTEDRIREIASRLMSEGGDDDVVCLQEMFHTAAAEWLARRIAPKYPFVVFNVNTQTRALNSGLFIASRYRFTRPVFWPHRASSGMDDYAGKGLLAVTIHVPVPDSATATCCVFTTHLNGGGATADAGWQTRALQLASVRRHSNAYISSIRPVLGAIVASDFNISPLEADGTVNHEWVKHRAWFCDSEHACHFTESSYARGTVYAMNDPCVGFDMARVDDWTIKPERVDHILSVRYVTAAVSTATTNPPPTRIDLPIPDCELCDDRMGGTSDHVAVRATLTFKLPTPQQRTSTPADDTKT